MKVLDKDHYGMEKVKERIVEYIAVLSLKGDMKSPILCLVGPPGTGKTSLGKSIAAAMKRKYVRVALGGLHDEAEIRGHRKTYVGAMPGRIIQSIKKAGVSNPVFVLDEIDKVQGMSHNGDPTSALLEVLDPEQNNAFHDNYLDLDYDLSKVLFVATANTLSTIQPALLDRMEVIDLSGYILEEKLEIAQRHLIPRQLVEHGFDRHSLKFSNELLTTIINDYTRESGVRQLEKTIAKIIRRRAVQLADGQKINKTIQASELKEILGLPIHNSERRGNEPKVGVVTGLAWTQVGGEILFIESSISKGKGTLTMTGNLGDVMKESATLAFEYLKSNADHFGVDMEKVENSNIHIHVPEGATPKDGPSAGITMFVAMVSAFTQKRVIPTVAMTGEITLRGQVTPVGGIKEKILAAKRAGITDLILCEDNRRDIEDIPQEYLAGLTFHYIREMKEALPIAFEK
jgi:ATP-dependent Lon protease